MKRNIPSIRRAPQKGDPIAGTFKLETYNAAANEVCKGLTPKQCRSVAAELEDRAAAIREALGSAGQGPQSHPRCTYHANYYLKIGLSPGQLRRLKHAAGILLKPEHSSSSNAAWYLLNVALSNLEIMERLLQKDLANTRVGSAINALEFFWERKARAAKEAVN